MSSLSRLILYTSGICALRKNDVILTSYPKSGNTWVRFLLANYISLKYLRGMQITFPRLDKLMPELGSSNLIKPWRYSEIPRVIKTHLPYSKIFKKLRTIGVVRDPRDVMVSYYHFLQVRDAPLFRGDFSGFIRNSKYGLKSWFEHTASWIEQWDLIVRYENLRSNPVEECKRLLEWLDVSVNDGDLKELVHRSDIRNISKSEKTAPPSRAKNDSKFRFIRNGQQRQWPEYFGDKDLDYLQKLKENAELNLYE